jgi:hypothetical protein
MTSLTPTARTVAATPGLGAVVKVYGPQTVSSLIGAAIAIAIGAAVTLVSAAVLDSDILPRSSNPFASSIQADPALLTNDHPALAHYLPLFGLLFVLIGVVAVIHAIANRSARVVLCQGGIAMATPKTTDAFTWHQVSSVKRRSQSSASTGAGGQTFYTVVRWYTVVLTHDGRRFVLDSRLIGGGAARKLGRVVKSSVRQAQAGVSR